MKQMGWLKMLKPTRWRVAISLLPFIFPLTQIVAALTIEHELLLLDSVGAVTLAILAVEGIVAQPLASLLELLPGFWSNNVLIAYPNGPLLPGSFAVAITYSVLIYLVWSLVSFQKGKRR